MVFGKREENGEQVYDDRLFQQSVQVFGDLAAKQGPE
jgi:hypothetical protein